MPKCASSLPRYARWFVFPVTLFGPQGRVILHQCTFHYSEDPNAGWHPTMEGSFGALTDRESNRYPNPPHPQLRFTELGDGAARPPGVPAEKER